MKNKKDSLGRKKKVPRIQNNFKASEKKIVKAEKRNSKNNRKVAKKQKKIKRSEIKLSSRIRKIASKEKVNFNERIAAFSINKRRVRKNNFPVKLNL